MAKALALLLLLSALSVGLPRASGQDAGLIVQGNRRGEASIGSLNPLRCDDSDCRRLDDLMFPKLLRVDPNTRALAPATPTDGLAESWEIDGDTLTFHLRGDRAWSDGKPITAYDVYFSYLAIVGDQIGSPYAPALQALIRAAAPVDASTFAVVLTTAGCDSLDRLNFPVVPAHVFAPSFAETVRFAGGDVVTWADAQPTRDFSAMVGHAFDGAPSVTAGPFMFDSRSYGEYLRLVSPDRTRAFAYVDAPDADEMVDRFLRGEINLLVDPPYNRRQDIRAAQGVTVIERPGTEWYMVRLNLADANNPLGATDEDGRPLDQGAHRLFSDPAVRRALQLAVDVPALIDAVFEGDAIPIGGALSPASWAYDNAAPPIFDPFRATVLLEAAGWKDLYSTGARTCLDCRRTYPGTGLTFELLHADNPTDTLLASLIVRQWGQVGFDVYATPLFSDSQTSEQSYSAVLESHVEPIPAAPDQTALFTPSGDVPGSGANTSSYANDAFTALLDQAARVPACELSTRAGLYAQAQQTLRDDAPAVWLLSPTRMIAVRGDARALQPFVEETLP